MSEPFDWMLKQPKAQAKLLGALDKRERNDFAYIWEYTARPEQLPPEGDWRVWMIMAGRGFGKTRSGAEWVRMIADAHPHARIALISSSMAEARAVMVEGESGLLAVCRPDHKPHYEPSLHRIRFASGAQAQLFSAAEPESLRGPQHSHASGPSAEGVLSQPSPQHSGRPLSAGRGGIPKCAACGYRGQRLFSDHVACQ